MNSNFQYKQFLMTRLNKDKKTCCWCNPKINREYRYVFDNIFHSNTMNCINGPEYLDNPIDLFSGLSPNLLQKSSDHIPIAAKLYY